MCGSILDSTPLMEKLCIHTDLNAFQRQPYSTQLTLTQMTDMKVEHNPQTIWTGQLYLEVVACLTAD